MKEETEASKKSTLVLPRSEVEVDLVAPVGYEAVSDDLPVLISDGAKKALEELAVNYRLGLKRFAEGNSVGAEESFVKVLKPVLSMPSKQNIDLDVVDCQDQLFESLNYLGEIYLYNTEEKYTNNFAKAAGIFQYSAAFAEKYKVSSWKKYKKQSLYKAYLCEQAFLETLKAYEEDSGKAAKELTTKSAVSAELAAKIKSTRYNEDEEYKKYKESLEKQYILPLEKLRKNIAEELAQLKYWSVKKIAARAVKIEELYQQTTKFFIESKSESKAGIVQQLLQECYEQLGESPCEFAIVGLGSLAGGKMTPYSDLEFAILIESDKEADKEYFRNLTKLLHIKVINFGETILPGLGIESLNNFKSGKAEDSWFWDDVVSAGFSFDGAKAHACKWPLGRKGYVGRDDYELILTPEQMAKFQGKVELSSKEEVAAEAEVRIESGGDKDENNWDDKGKGELDERLEAAPDSRVAAREVATKIDWFEKDKHLVQGLRSTVLIDGSQKLLDQYRSGLEFTEADTAGRAQAKKQALVILKNDLEKFKLKLGDEEEGKLFNVKMDIYRIGDRVIDALADYYLIQPELRQDGLTVWQKLDKMYELGYLNIIGTQHLKEAISIATELRLNTYCHNKGQSDHMSVYEFAVDHLDKKQVEMLKEKTFYVKDTSHLHHFYYIMLGLQVEVNKFKGPSQSIKNYNLSKSFMYASTNYAKALVHARFLEYDRAREYFEKTEKQKPKNMFLLHKYFKFCMKTSALDKALELASHQKEMIDKNPEKFTKVEIADVYNNLGRVYREVGKYELALEYYEKAFKIWKEVHKANLDHPNVALSYGNLGNVYESQEEYEQAIKYYKKALNIESKIYKSDINHPNIAVSYHNLGNVYGAQGKYDEAIKYYKKALNIESKTHKPNVNDSNIAASYHNLGNAYGNMGEFYKAIEYHKKALNIEKKIYKFNSEHQNIAISYHSVGGIYNQTGEYDQAIECYNNAISIQQVIYKNNPSHPNIAALYNNLGGVYKAIGKYDEAIEYYSKALNSWKKIYKFNPNNSKTAGAYYNLGGVYEAIGKYDEAIKCQEQALNIQKTIQQNKSKFNSNYRTIALNYNSLGDTYIKKGEYGKAEEYYSQVLNILKEIYNTDLKHPDIANIYNSLGNICEKQEKYDEAFNYHQRALEINKKYYAANLAHPYIAANYNNLGTIYYKTERYDKAIESYKKALEIRQKVYKANPNHPDIAGDYNNLAIVYSMKKEYSIAKEYYKKASEIFELYKFFEHHPHIASHYNNLSCYYRNKKEYTNSIECLEKALTIYKKVYGFKSSHPSIVITCKNLGEAYQNIKKYDESIKCYEEALRILQEVHKADLIHSSIANIYNSLGNVYSNKGEYDKAIKYDTKALDIWKELYKASPSTELNYLGVLMAYNNLCLSYMNNKECDKVLEYYREANIGEESYDSLWLHLNIVEGCNNLGKLYEHIGKFGKAIEYYFISQGILKQTHKVLFDYAFAVKRDDKILEGLKPRQKALEEATQINLSLLGKKASEKSEEVIAGKSKESGSVTELIADDKHLAANMIDLPSYDLDLGSESLLGLVTNFVHAGSEIV